MQIFVKNLYGKTVTVNVEFTSDTVGSLKAKLEESEGIPPQHQRLIYNARILINEHKLSDYNIKKDSTLHLSFHMGSCGGECCRSVEDPRPDEESIYIHVQTRTSKTLALQVEPSSDTIADVRQKICDHQSLFVDGIKLEDDRKLGYYCMIAHHDDATLHLDFGMQVFVKTTLSKTITVDVDPSDTVGDVKAKIYDQERLAFDSRLLNNKRNLDFYKVQHHSTLYLGRICSSRDDAMPIVVKTLPGSASSEAIRFKVKLSDRIGDLKAKIQDQQRLFFKGQELVDGDGQRTLADYNVQRQSTLHIDCPMQVFVKTTSTGQTITLEVEPSDTIEHVKEKIGSGSLPLNFDGKKLDDGKTLAECNVHMWSTLHLDA